MRYHNITKDDMLNGDGLRVVLWVAGCSHCCKECHNPITWDPNGGLEFDEAAKQEIFDELEKDYIHGITFSGGDPLHMANAYDVTQLAKEIRKKYPNKSIWLYTGAKWEEVKNMKIVKYLCLSALSCRLLLIIPIGIGKAPEYGFVAQRACEL